MAPATSLHAGLIAAIFLALSARVILYRRAHRVSMGDRGDAVLARRIRAQANCAEYAPVGIVLLLLLELQGFGAAILHALGLMLVAGRAIHGWGFTRSDTAMWPRVGGMALTLTMIGICALLLLISAL